MSRTAQLRWSLHPSVMVHTLNTNKTAVYLCKLHRNQEYYKGGLVGGGIHRCDLVQDRLREILNQ